MAKTLSEQVAALEAERDLLKANQGVDPEYKVNYERLAAKYDGALRRAVDAESALAQARVEGARELTKALVAAIHDSLCCEHRTFDAERSTIAANVQIFAENWMREYPATGEEPTRGKKPNLGMPYTRCRACDSLRDWEGRCDDCDGPRPAPPAVTEPPEDEAWGWAVVNKNGNVATTHGGYPALITVTEARRRGMPRNGGDWIDALCALLNANTGDELAPFTVLRLHAWAALASRPTASGEG